ncbi:MAG: hypothetical protein K6G51_03900 [Sphaerochaetaceae bacterium]|nr:hypothetical protein [Sphaerochaetaceae bacterium]
MAISKADWDLMEKVAAYYESTKKTPEELKEQRENQRLRGYEPRTDNPGSISETASHFKMTRTKVTKILVTMGSYTSPMVEEIQKLRRQGLSVKEIAEFLGVSLGMVSSYIPYTDEIHNTLDPCDHTAKVREYRAYERMQGQRTNKRKGDCDMENTDNWKSEWEKEKRMSYREDYHRPMRVTWDNLENMLPEDIYKAYQEKQKEIEAYDKSNRDRFEKLIAIPESKLTDEQREMIEDLKQDLGIYPGALNSRNNKELEDISGEHIPFEPKEIMRLHLELIGVVDESDIESLKDYGGAKDGVITRDMIVPANIPLYALHYAIQRAFGWQNSHLHEFTLGKGRQNELCEGRTEEWLKMVGILFRSPLMDEDAQFWADDYEGGSFRNWLRKKYTGPYLSQCHEEGLYSCLEDMKDITPETEMNVAYMEEVMPAKENDNSDFAKVKFIDFAEFKQEKRLYSFSGKKIETIKFKDYPLERLALVFNVNPFALVERLPLDSILCPGWDRLHDNYPESNNEAQFIEENTCKTISEELEFIEDKIRAAVEMNEDSPFNQVIPKPFATELIYNYDFVDEWKVRITASWNCADLVEEGIVDQSTLDRANIKCRETYRPVLIAREGEMVMDDVGGLSGFANFLRDINPVLKDMASGEKVTAKQDKKEWLEWAKGQGWKRNDSSDMSLM